MNKADYVEHASTLVLELVEAARRFGWKQAGGEYTADQEAIVKDAASRLGTAFKTILKERDDANAMADQWAEKLSALHSQANEREGWFSIYDRVPEIGATCLVLSQNQWETAPSIKIDRWDEQHECPVSWSSANVPIGPGWDDHYVPNDVTHWMPLPAAPTGGSET